MGRWACPDSRERDRCTTWLWGAFLTISGSVWPSAQMCSRASISSRGPPSTTSRRPPASGGRLAGGHPFAGILERPRRVTMAARGSAALCVTRENRPSVQRERLRQGLEPPPTGPPDGFPLPAQPGVGGRHRRPRAAERLAARLPAPRSQPIARSDRAPDLPRRSHRSHYRSGAKHAGLGALRFEANVGHLHRDAQARVMPVTSGATEPERLEDVIDLHDESRADEIDVHRDSCTRVEPGHCGTTDHDQLHVLFGQRSLDRGGAPRRGARCPRGARGGVRARWPSCQPSVTVGPISSAGSPSSRRTAASSASRTRSRGTLRGSADAAGAPDRAGMLRRGVRTGPKISAATSASAPASAPRTSAAGMSPRSAGCSVSSQRPAAAGSPIWRSTSAETLAMRRIASDVAGCTRQEDGARSQAEARCRVTPIARARSDSTGNQRESSAYSAGSSAGTSEA